MSNFDDDIRKALLDGPSEEELRELTEEKGYFSEIGTLFRGRNRWITIIGYIEAFAFFGLGIWAVVKILDNPAEPMLSIYQLIAIFGFLITVLIKIWFWIQMNKNATVREILRLELRIQELQKALQKK